MFQFLFSAVIKDSSGKISEKLLQLNVVNRNPNMFFFFFLIDDPSKL